MNELILSNIEIIDIILEDMKSIIDLSKQQAFNAVNFMLIRRNQFIGQKTATEETHTTGIVEYSAEIIAGL